MEQIEILDVTKIEPRFKHPTIFNKFDDLGAGHAFVIHNDHDPKPLYYQLLGERGNIFQWEYLESGPEWWKVKISKNGAKDQVEILDVTKIEPRFKHPTIFNKFDNLEAGQAFIIHNDHDPKPLYYQLLGERGNIFQWDYLESGPEWWKVKISKNGANAPTVGDIAAKDYRKAEVFKKLGIDFCCGGKKTIKEVCEEAGITEAHLEAELLKAENSKKSPSQDYNNWDVDFLTDYIVNTHHRYVSDNIEIIYGLAQKVAGHHGATSPEAQEVANIFGKMASELMHHMEKEETVLFPYIKGLAAIKKSGEKIDKSPFDTVKNPILMMENEHESAGNDFRLLRQATNDYMLPQGACNSFMYLYEKLKEFEEDLHQHIHLENNILFPKSLSLEKELLK